MINFDISEKKSGSYTGKILPEGITYLIIKEVSRKAIGLDYGQKRIGISISDSSQIIATGLTTVINKNIFHFLNNLFVRRRNRYSYSRLFKKFGWN